MSISRREWLAAGPALLGSGLLWPALRAAGAKRGESPLTEVTPRSQEAVRRGNLWMMRTFNRDGGCGIDIGQLSDISCTAVVGLALMSQGNTPVEGPSSRQIRRVTHYLVDAVRNTRFTIDLHSQVRADLSGYADHHFAALFLSQVLGEGWQVEPVRGALVDLVRWIVGGQSPVGHWGQGRYPDLAAITGWCSLRGAHHAGLSIQASAQRTAEFLLEHMKAGLASGDRSLFATAAGIRVLYAMGLEHSKVADEAFRRVIKTAKSDFPSFSNFGGEQYLAFHLINETMLQRGGSYWRQWFPMVRDKIIDVQNRDGSWTGYSCITSRTFCTACSILVLTSPNRYLPISQP